MAKIVYGISGKKRHHEPSGTCIVHSASSGANGLSTTGGVFFFAANSKKVSATKTKPRQIKRGIVIAFHGLANMACSKPKRPFFYLCPHWTN